MEQPKRRVARLMEGACAAHTDEGVDEAALRRLLDDFGNALEEVVNGYHVGLWVLFPIFRPFNIVAGYTPTDILYIVSPNPGGLPSYEWSDFRRDPSIDQSMATKDIAKVIRFSKGWERTATIYTFPLDTLNMNPSEREVLLRRLAEEQFWVALRRALIASLPVRDVLIAAFFAAVFGVAFLAFPQLNLWIIAIILGILVAAIFRIRRARS